jgi:hypothetical protein
VTQKIIITYIKEESKESKEGQTEGWKVLASTLTESK